MLGLLLCVEGWQVEFRLCADRPDEADEFAGESSDDLASWLALVGEEPVATMQALLGSPSDGGNFRRELFLEPLLSQTEMRTMTIVPGGLDQDAAQVRVSGFGDRADAALASAGTLRRYETRVAHDFAGALETKERANSVARVMAVSFATPRRDWRASTMALRWAGAAWTARSMAASSRSMRWA